MRCRFVSDGHGGAGWEVLDLLEVGVEWGIPAPSRLLGLAWGLGYASLPRKNFGPHESGRRRSEIVSVGNSGFTGFVWELRRIWSDGMFFFFHFLTINLAKLNLTYAEMM